VGLRESLNPTGDRKKAGKCRKQRESTGRPRADAGQADQCFTGKDVQVMGEIMAITPLRLVAGSSIGTIAVRRSQA
jgi:hypothetical protein